MPVILLHTIVPMAFSGSEIPKNLEAETATWKTGSFNIQISGSFKSYFVLSKVFFENADVK